MKPNNIPMIPPKDVKISQLIEDFGSGKLSLPEIQRGYVWKAKQVAELLDSLYRGYPSGTILTWKGGAGIQKRKSAIEQDSSAQFENNNEATDLLLDGQQRLTSLQAILNGKFVEVKDKPIRIGTLFNLRYLEPTEIKENAGSRDDSAETETKEQDKMIFATSSKSLQNKAHWISVSDFFKSLNKGGDIESFLKNKKLDGHHTWIKKYRERLAKLQDIKNYKYRVDTLDASVTYPEITEIFVRVNSKGTKLRSSDLALAQITAKWHKSLQIFEKFAAECKAKGFDFDLGIYIRNLVVFATEQCKFDIIRDISEADLREAWKKSEEGMRFALSFLKENTEMSNSILMSSPVVSIVIAYYAHKKEYNLSDEDEENLKRWALLANIKSSYSRSIETYLDRDLRPIKNNIDSALQRLIEILEEKFGTINISMAELKGKNTASAHFSTMFMAFRDAGAKDWCDKTKISLDNDGKQKFEFHHIFPQVVLKDNYTPEQINDICNLAFITNRTNNEKIGGKEPIEYIEPFDGYEDMFSKQCIPTDKELLELENYGDFLEKRRKLIADRLNEFLGTEAS